MSWPAPSNAPTGTPPPASPSPQPPALPSLQLPTTASPSQTPSPPGSPQTPVPAPVPLPLWVLESQGLIPPNPLPGQHPPAFDIVSFNVFGNGDYYDAIPASPPQQPVAASPVFVSGQSQRRVGRDSGRGGGRRRRYIVRAEDLKPPKIEELRDMSMEELLTITDYDLYKRQRTHLENMRKKSEYCSNLEAAIQEFPPLALLVRRKPGSEDAILTGGGEADIKRSKSTTRPGHGRSQSSSAIPPSTSSSSLTSQPLDPKSLLPKLHLPSPSSFLGSLSTPSTPSGSRARSASPGLFLKSTGDTLADLERRQLNYFESTAMYKAEAARKDAQIKAAREALENLGVFDYLRRVGRGEKGVEPRFATEVREKLAVLRRMREEALREVSTPVGEKKNSVVPAVVERPKTPEIQVIPPESTEEKEKMEVVERVKAAEEEQLEKVSEEPVKTPEAETYFNQPTSTEPEPEPMALESPVSRLPPELLSMIFTYLYPTNLTHNSDTLSIVLTCRKWHDIMMPIAYRVISFGENYEEVRESLSKAAFLRVDQSIEKHKNEIRFYRRSDQIQRNGPRILKRGDTVIEELDVGKEKGLEIEKEREEGVKPIETEMQRQLRGPTYVRVKPGNMCLVGMKSTIGILTALQNPKIAAMVREVRYMATSAHSFPNAEVLELYKGSDVRYAIDLRERACDKVTALVKSAARCLRHVEAVTIEGGTYTIVGYLLGLLKWSRKIDMIKLSNVNLRCLDMVRGESEQKKARMSKAGGQEKGKDSVKVDFPRVIHENVKTVILSCLFYSTSTSYKDSTRPLPSSTKPAWLLSSYRGAKKLARFLDTFPNVTYLEIDGSDIPIEPVLNAYFDDRGRVFFPRRPVPKPPSPVDFGPTFTNDVYIPGYTRSKQYEHSVNVFDGSSEVEKIAVMGKRPLRRMVFKSLERFNVSKCWIVSSKKDLKSVPGDWISTPGWEEFFMRMPGLTMVGFHGGILSRHLTLADPAFNRVASHIGRTLTHLTLVHDTSFKPMHTRTFYPDIPHKPHARGFNIARCLALLRHLKSLEKLDLAVIYPGIGMRHVLAIAETLRNNKMKILNIHLVHDLITLEQVKKLVEFLPGIEELTLVSPIPFVPGAVFNVSEDSKSSSGLNSGGGVSGGNISNGLLVSVGGGGPGGGGVNTMMSSAAGGPGGGGGVQPTTYTTFDPSYFATNDSAPPSPPLYYTPLPSPPLPHSQPNISYPPPPPPASLLPPPPGSIPNPNLPPIPPQPYIPSRPSYLHSFDLDLLLRALSPLRNLTSLALPYLYPLPLELADIDSNKIPDLLGYLHVPTGVRESETEKKAGRVKRAYLKALERVGRGFCGFRDPFTPASSSSSTTTAATTVKAHLDEPNPNQKVKENQKERLFPHLRYIELRYFHPEEPMMLALLEGGRGWYCWDFWGEAVRSWVRSLREEEGRLGRVLDELEEEEEEEEGGEEGRKKREEVRRRREWVGEVLGGVGGGEIL